MGRCNSCGRPSHGTSACSPVMLLHTPRPAFPPFLRDTVRLRIRMALLADDLLDAAHATAASYVVMQELDRICADDDT